MNRNYSRRLGLPFGIFALIVGGVAGCEKKEKDGGVCEVAQVEWVGVRRNDGQTNLDVGGNPANRGGGDRIFPDRDHPSGTAGQDDPHDRVLVRATLTDASPPDAVVFFRLFDMDHYSADAGFDPNGVSAPNDNVRERLPLTIDVGAELRTADFSAVSTQAPANARVAELGLQITRPQPGNNWRVAASCVQAELDGMVIGEDGQTLQISTADATAVAGSAQSPLLTVWRRVHAEVDRMDRPIFNAGAGRSRFDGGGAAPAGGADVTLVLGGDAIVPSQTDQFENGRIELLDGANNSLGVFGVTANTTGGGPTVTIAGAVPGATANFRGLEDDDVTNASANKVDDSADMQSDTSRWVAQFEPGLVMPVFDQTEVAANNSSTVAFDVHVGDDNTDAVERASIRATVLANKGSRSEPLFWVIYQLGGFQGRTDEEVDPSADPGTAGVSSFFSQAPADTRAGTIVYAESSRDVPETSGAGFIGVANLRAVTSVHEAAHEFGLADGSIHGSLMDAPQIGAADTQPELDALQINGPGFRLFMLTEQPGHDPQ